MERMNRQADAPGAELEGQSGLAVFEPEELRARALRYYEAVDSGSVPAVVGCFSDDAVYRRPGYEPIVGAEGLEAFYSGERVIASGRHEATDVVVEGMRAAVHGRFRGRLKDGSDTEVGFADFFVFDDAGRIAQRTTYFYAPSV